MAAPTERDLELFRIVEDVQDVTGARVVLVTDDEGRAVAISGDEDDVPAPLRAVLGGRALAQAGSAIALLSSVDLSSSRLNVVVHDVGHGHVLAIVFDAEADFVTVQTVGREAKKMIGETLGASMH